MEDEDGYTMMTPRGKRGAAGSPGPLRDAGPGCPPWHRTALWASCLGHLVLGAAVVALGSWVCQQSLKNMGSHKNECVILGNDTTTLENMGSQENVGIQDNVGSQENGSRSLGNDNATWEKVFLELRKGLCPSQSPEGGGCWLCPVGWKMRRNKCYWFGDSTTRWNWTQSREGCENRGSELLVPKDRDELESISKILPSSSRSFWIGLSFTNQGWTWLNGSHLDQSWLSQTSGNGSVGCGSLKGNKIGSHLCTEGLRWICQKGSTLL